MILVDPASISIPNYATSAEEALELVNRLVHFSLVCSKCKQVMVLVSDFIEEELGLSGGGLSEIRDFLDLMNLSYIFDARDVFNGIRVLQHQSTRLSDWDGWFQVEAAIVQITPALPGGLEPSRLMDFTRANLLFVSLAGARGVRLYLTSSLVGAASAMYDLRAEELTVLDRNSLVEVALHEGPAFTISHFGDLVSGDHAYAVWAKANNERDLTVAIALGAMMTLKAAGLDYQAAGDFFLIGEDFLSSLQSNQALGSGRYSREVARICFELVAGVFAGTDKEFGAGSAIVRKRDGAVGRRVHVSKSGVALRLMYWRLSSGGVEFANVGPKHELLISLGDGRPASKCDLVDLRAGLGLKSS